MSTPSKRTVPADAWCSPEIIRSVVVLPAPFAPSSVTISPWSTEIVKSCRAGTVP